MRASRSAAPGASLAGARSTPYGRRLRAGFAVVQLALSLALLVGALMMVTTVRGLRGVEPGFDPRGVSVHYVDLSSQGYRPPQATVYLRDLRTALSTGGVSTFAFSYSYPFSTAFIQQAQGPGGPDDRVEVRTNAITRDYFAVLGVPFLAGRPFTDDEALASGAASGTAVIVGKSLAARLFGSANPLGQTVTMPRGKSARLLTVVGVVDDVLRDLESGEIELTLYEPLAREALFVLRPTILIKSSTPLPEVTETVRRIAARIDRRAPVSGNLPLQALVDREMSDQRVFAWVLSLLGGLGFLLASVGVHGLLAQTVAERVREFGIRQAIGATPRQIVGLVARGAAWVAAIGSLVGLALAVLGTRLIESRLWGVVALEPGVYAVAVVALMLVVFIAAAWPARTATRVQAVEALRIE
jgi:hypothetical protein